MKRGSLGTDANPDRVVHPSKVDATVLLNATNSKDGGNSGRRRIQREQDP